MHNLLDGFVPVQFDASDLDAYVGAIEEELVCEPSEDDYLWLDTEMDVTSDHGEPDPIDDLDWLEEEADGLEARGGPGLVAATAIREVMGHLERFGVRSVSAYGVGYVGSPYDSKPRRRKTALAASLDVTAAWYAHLDTPAATFAAAAIQCWSNHAENLGSDDAHAFFHDDEAYEAAGVESDAADDDDFEFTEDDLRRFEGHAA